MKPPLFTASGPGWRVREGQAIWRPQAGQPELGGELVLACHQDGAWVLEFAKTPLVLVLAQSTGTNWFLRFPPGQASFAGRSPPPSRFVWLHLPAALAGDSLPPDCAFQRKPDGNWRLENRRTGEALEGFLSP
jgi:hypothetical protein